MADLSTECFMGATTQNASASVTPRLKLWNAEHLADGINCAKTSNDGELIALLTDSHSVHVTHISNSYVKFNLANDVHCFLWGVCDWRNQKCLTYPTPSKYLVALGLEHNIDIYSFSNNGSDVLTSSLVTSIEPCLLHFDEEIPSIYHVSVICFLNNMNGSSHQLVCIINKIYLVQINVSSTEETYVAKKLNLDKFTEKSEYKDNVKLHEYKDGVLYILTDHFLLYMFSVNDFHLVKKINIYERLQLYDVLYFGVSIAVDSYTVTLITADNQINFLKLPPLAADYVSEQKWSHTDLWKDMLKHTKKACKLKYSGHSSPRYDNSNDDASIILLPGWMNDFHVINFHVSNTVVLLVQENIQNKKQRIVTKYNSLHDEFVFNELPSDTCLSFCWNEYYPMLLISPTMVSIPTFSTTQEELIDKIIQYSDIHLAEIICKSNEWDQFSIPLHTLEIGLQQRQLDVVNFFLKSREKAFSRYWEEIRNSLVSNENGIDSMVCNEASEGNEMCDAIEMVIKALNSNSKGKHKQNFFEGLLRVSIVHLNGLLQDAAVAIEIKNAIENSNQINMSSCIGTSSFLYGVTNSVKYLTEKLIELREYLRHPIEDDRKIEEVTKDEIIVSNEFIEDHLTNGKIATLQKLLCSQGRESESKLSNIFKLGRATVHEMLKEKNVDRAEKILRNMGLDSDKELKEIYLKTIEIDLRDFLYAVLKNKNLMSEEDVEDYLYVKKVEDLFNGKNHDMSTNNNVFNLVNGLKESASNTVKDTQEKQAAGNDSILFCQFSLECVKSWDDKKRRLEMLDAIFINDAEVTIGNEYSTELWDYLILHNQISILQTWIGNVTLSQPTSCNQSFPELPEEMPLEFISDETKDTLLNLLVKNGYYPECIMSKFPDLLHYLGTNNILFNDVHPMVYYKKTILDEQRNDLVNQFNNDFICFCQDNELVMVMWHYICHYGISLSSITIKDKIKSWLSMMLSFHDVATKWKESSEDKDSLLFAAFAENARFVHDESANCSEPYTLDDMFRNNQPIIALASVLVCQNKFNGVFSDSDGSLDKVDKKLLEEALHLYPQLYEAICCGDSNNTGDSDITMYKLLQDNSELDISRWFCWQSNNSVAGEGDNILRELPHFSSSPLLKRYAQEIKLDHMFYLEQGRPMYAYLVYSRDFACIEDKQNLAKNIVTMDAYRLGVENFDKLPIIASCCFFLDLLEVDNERLKTDARVAMNISKYWKRQPADVKKHSADELKNYLVDSLLRGKPNQLMEIVQLLENTTDLIIQDNKIKRLSYDAVWYWDLVMLFCRLHKLPLSTHYIKICCEENDWLQLFLFIHLYQVPPEQVVSVVENHMKNKVLRDHIIAIVRNIKATILSKPEEKQRKRKSKDYNRSKQQDKRDVRAHLYSRLGSVSSKEKLKDRSSSTSITSNNKREERSNSANTLSPEEQPLINTKDFKLPEMESIPDNVIDIILICDTLQIPWKSLLAYGLVLFNEIFPPLAACYENADLITCQCIWYICSVSEDRNGLMLSLCKDLLGMEINLDEAPLALYDHNWSEKDLSILVKGILKEGVKYSKLVVQGFRIFQENDIRKYILEFFQLFIFDEEMHLSLEKLKQFQSEYEINRKKNFVESCFKSKKEIEVCEEFSNEVIHVLMTSYKHTYQLRNLVGLLSSACYGRNFIKKVPDYVSIRKTIDIIYKTNIGYPVKKLCNANESFNTESINVIFDKLLKTSCFKEATELAQLHCLPQSKITRQKVVHDLEEMKKTRSWKVLSTRHAFLNKVDKIFFNSKCCCNLAASFFEEQATDDKSIYTYIERSFLLLLAMQWYQSSMIAEKTTKVHELEKQVWKYQIKAEVEAKNNPNKERTPLIRYTLSSSDLCDISEAYFQRPCSTISMAQCNDLTELLQEMKDGDDEELETALLSTEEEISAFERFVCKLLDKNCITEARRVASYFRRSTMDLEIILAGIYLAQGNQTVDGLGENIKAILAGTTSRHITISALLERSGSFTRLDPPHSPVVPSGGCMTDFVFIEEIQNALEKLTLRVNCGKKCLQKVLVSFKIATMLSMSYEDTVTEDYFIILREMLVKGIDQRRQLSKQFIKAFDLPSDEVAKFVAEMMIIWIKASCGIDVGDLLLENQDLSLLSSHTFNDIVSLLQLTEDAAQVGKLILEEMIRLSKANRTGSRTSSDLTCEVELLIYAHHCFTISCEMEGIARILHFAGLCTKSLARLQLHSQMVRLLTGIGRFNEMVYVIETLYNQHHFELLCKQGHLKEKQLKTALLDFLKKYHPKDHESFGIVAHAFGMHREMAKHHETVGLEKIDKIKREVLSSSKDYIILLKDVKETFTCAADYYVKEECLRHAQKCIRAARLVELQIQLLPVGIRVLGLTSKNVKMFLKKHKNFLESYIVADSYDLTIPSCWVEPIYHIVVLNGNFNYLQQYESYFHITTTIAMEVAAMYRKEKNVELSGNMKRLLTHVRDLKTKLKLARELNFNDMESQLLDGTAGAYLRDQVF